VINLLLDEGADVNAQVPDPGSALYLASEGDYEAVVQLLPGYHA
jgi:hypothetical protein